jgi:hypothetical protein
LFIVELPKLGNNLLVLASIGVTVGFKNVPSRYLLWRTNRWRAKIHYWYPGQSYEDRIRLPMKVESGKCVPQTAH